MTSNKAGNLTANTAILYFRMLVTMLIGFYTTRVVLNALGVADFGLSSVIGSVSGMFSFLSGALATAASRFFCFHIGRQNTKSLQRVFSILVELYGILGVVIIILSETLGLWIMNTQIIIPPEQLRAAYIFFQFMVFTLVFGLFTIPFSAMIISYENMKVYAFLSIGDSVLKLGIVFLLFLFDSSRLEIYGGFLCVAALLHTGLYGFFCLRAYPQNRFRFYWNKRKVKEILHFSGWQLWGAVSILASDSLVNILLNNYYGVFANAARSIALQLNGCLGAFSQSFMTAANPRIVKHWANNESFQFQRLIHQSSRISFFLLWLVAFPVLIELDFILHIWLKDVPPYTTEFARWVIITLLINSLSYPLMVAAGATGRIALYQLIVGGILILVFPFSWLVLSLGGGAASPMQVGLGCSVIALVARLFMLQRISSFHIGVFLNIVIFRSILICGLALIVPLLICLNFDDGWLRFFVVGTVCEIISVFLIWFIGFKKIERKNLVELARLFLQERLLISASRIFLQKGISP